MQMWKLATERWNAFTSGGQRETPEKQVEEPPPPLRQPSPRPPPAGWPTRTGESAAINCSSSSLANGSAASTTTSASSPSPQPQDQEPESRGPAKGASVNQADADDEKRSSCTPAAAASFASSSVAARDEVAGNETEAAKNLRSPAVGTSASAESLSASRAAAGIADTATGSTCSGNCEPETTTTTTKTSKTSCGRIINSPTRGCIDLDALPVPEKLVVRTLPMARTGSSGSEKKSGKKGSSAGGEQEDSRSTVGKVGQDRKEASEVTKGKKSSKRPAKTMRKGSANGSKNNLVAGGEDCSTRRGSSADAVATPGGTSRDTSEGVPTGEQKNKGGATTTSAGTSGGSPSSSVASKKQKAQAGTSTLSSKSTNLMERLVSGASSPASSSEQLGSQGSEPPAALKKIARNSRATQEAPPPTEDAENSGPVASNGGSGGNRNVQERQEANGQLNKTPGGVGVGLEAAGRTRLPWEQSRPAGRGPTMGGMSPLVLRALKEKEDTSGSQTPATTTPSAPSASTAGENVNTAKGFGKQGGSCKTKGGDAKNRNYNSATSSSSYDIKDAGADAYARQRGWGGMAPRPSASIGDTATAHRAYHQLLSSTSSLLQRQGASTPGAASTSSSGVTEGPSPRAEGGPMLLVGGEVRAQQEALAGSSAASKAGSQGADRRSSTQIKQHQHMHIYGGRDHKAKTGYYATRGGSRTPGRGGNGNSNHPRTLTVEEETQQWFQGERVPWIHYDAAPATGAASTSNSRRTSTAAAVSLTEGSGLGVGATSPASRAGGLEHYSETADGKAVMIDAWGKLFLKVSEHSYFPLDISAAPPSTATAPSTPAAASGHTHTTTGDQEQQRAGDFIRDKDGVGFQIADAAYYKNGGSSTSSSTSTPRKAGKWTPKPGSFRDPEVDAASSRRTGTSTGGGVAAGVGGAAGASSAPANSRDASSRGVSSRSSVSTVKGAEGAVPCEAPTPTSATSTAGEGKSAKKSKRKKPSAAAATPAAGKQQANAAASYTQVSAPKNNAAKEKHSQPEKSSPSGAAKATGAEPQQKGDSAVLQQTSSNKPDAGGAAATNTTKPSPAKAQAEISSFHNNSLQQQLLQATEHAQQCQHAAQLYAMQMQLGKVGLGAVPTTKGGKSGKALFGGSKDHYSANNKDGNSTTKGTGKYGQDRAAGSREWSSKGGGKVEQPHSKAWSAHSASAAKGATAAAGKNLHWSKNPAQASADQVSGRSPMSTSSTPTPTPPSGQHHSGTRKPTASMTSTPGGSQPQGDVGVGGGPPTYCLPMYPAKLYGSPPAGIALGTDVEQTHVMMHVPAPGTTMGAPTLPLVGGMAPGTSSASVGSGGQSINSHTVQGPFAAYGGGGAQLTQQQQLQLQQLLMQQHQHQLQILKLQQQAGPMAMQQQIAAMAQHPQKGVGLGTGGIVAPAGAAGPGGVFYFQYPQMIPQSQPLAAGAVDAAASSSGLQNKSASASTSSNSESSNKNRFSTPKIKEVAPGPTSTPAQGKKKADGGGSRKSQPARELPAGGADHVDATDSSSPPSGKPKGGKKNKQKGAGAANAATASAGGGPPQPPLLGGTLQSGGSSGSTSSPAAAGQATPQTHQPTTITAFQDGVLQHGILNKFLPPQTQQQQQLQTGMFPPQQRGQQQPPLQQGQLHPLDAASAMQQQMQQLGLMGANTAAGTLYQQFFPVPGGTMLQLQPPYPSPAFANQAMPQQRNRPQSSSSSSTTSAAASTANPADTAAKQQIQQIQTLVQSGQMTPQQGQAVQILLQHGSHAQMILQQQGFAAAGIQPPMIDAKIINTAAPRSSPSIAAQPSSDHPPLADVEYDQELEARLDTELRTFVQGISLTEGERQERLAWVGKLAKVLEDDGELEVFGSLQSNLALFCADVDVLLRLKSSGSGSGSSSSNSNSSSFGGGSCSGGSGEESSGSCAGGKVNGEGRAGSARAARESSTTAGSIREDKDGGAMGEAEKAKNLSHWDAPSGAETCTPSSSLQHIELICEKIKDKLGDQIETSQVIKSASTPLLKLWSSSSPPSASSCSTLRENLSWCKQQRNHVETDIVLSEEGVQTTKWISSQMTLYAKLEFPVVLKLIKFLLLEHDLQETFSGGCGSFLLGLLLVHFLQVRQRELQLGEHKSDFIKNGWLNKAGRLSLIRTVMEFFFFYSRVYNGETIKVAAAETQEKDGSKPASKTTTYRRGGAASSSYSGSLSVLSPVKEGVDLGAKCFKWTHIRSLFWHSYDAFLHVLVAPQPTSGDEATPRLNLIDALFPSRILAAAPTTGGEQRVHEVAQAVVPEVPVTPPPAVSGAKITAASAAAPPVLQGTKTNAAPKDSGGPSEGSAAAAPACQTASGESASSSASATDDPASSDPPSATEDKERDTESDKPPIPEDSEPEVEHTPTGKKELPQLDRQKAEVRTPAGSGSERKKKRLIGALSLDGPRANSKKSTGSS